MVEALKRVRGPVAWVVVVGLGVGMLLDFVQSLTSGGDEWAAWNFDQVALTVFGPGHAALLLVAVGACCVWSDPTPRAGALAWVGFVIAVVAALAQAVFGVLGVVQLASLGVWVPKVAEWARLVLGPCVTVATAVALFALARGGRTWPQPAAIEADTTEKNPTTWRPDQAAGAAWTTASGAASGAQASGWGVPGERGGWNPRGDQPALGAGEAYAPGSSTTRDQPATGQPQAYAANDQRAHQPGQPGQPGPDHPHQRADRDGPAGFGDQHPQIIYPDADGAADTTQFRGRWEPNRRE